jgi:hypothetical protein
MNDIKRSWIYQDELRLIEELHTEFLPTEESLLRQVELITLIDELIKR